MGDATGYFSTKAMKTLTSFKFIRTGSTFGDESGHHTDHEQAPNSPAPHLLKSNNPPSEKEKMEVKEALLIARARYLALQERLDQTNHTTRIDAAAIVLNGQDTNARQPRLKKSISMIQSFIQMHESILSIIRILPTEILSLIFIFCLPHLEPHSWHRQPWKVTFSFRISQVSRRWRKVAHNTPQLWAILGDVPLNSRTAKPGWHSYYSFIKEVLRRSRGEDLWIYVYAPLQQYGRDGHPVISLLLRHVEKWAVLTIESSCMTVNSFSSLGQSQHPIEFPRLRKLGLELWRYPQGLSISGFQSAPAMTEVSIRGIYPSRLQVPWSQLRVYRESSFGAENMMGSLGTVLKHSTNLERLEIIGLGYFVPFPPAAQSNGLLLKHLKTLHLKFDTIRPDNAVKDLLDGLILPSLEELKIGGYPGEVVPVLISLVLRPKLLDFPLRRLFLRTEYLRQGHLSNLLMHTPKLEELDLHFPLPLLDMFNLIAGGRAQNMTEKPPMLLVPMLRRLTFHGKPQDIDESTILALARSRFENRNNKSSTLRLNFPDRVAALVALASLNSWEKTARSHCSSPSFNQSHECHRNETLPGGKVTTVFESWRRRLHRELPELHGAAASRKRKIDLGFPSRVSILLTEIEELELSSKTEVTALWISKLHHSLRRLSGMRASRIPGDKVHRFCQRSEQILKKWESAFQAEVSKISWVLKGEQSLLFIAEDDPLRTSSDVSGLVYGLQDDLSMADRQWPDHM